jgi:hypothetical protein
MFDTNVIFVICFGRWGCTEDKEKGSGIDIVTNA